LSESYSDGELVRRALAGDLPSFAALCERHRERVWRIVRSIAPGAEAEDLAQEAIVRAYLALRTYHGEAPFEAWLCRIALNAARDYQRSAWGRRVLLFERLPEPAADPHDSPEGEVERRDLQRRVRQAVARLPESQRVPVWLHFMEGFSLAEVARLERTPEATVRSRLRAGLRRLALSLDDLLAGGAEYCVPLEAQQKGCRV
jgi:RNA polymerase sigma factor (sigma-70 family)